MESEVTINDLAEFLGKPGTLHDVRIAKIEADIKARCLTIFISNLFACVPNQSESSPVPGKLLFHGLHELKFSLWLPEGVRISMHEFKEESSHFWTGIYLNEGAGIDPPACPIEVEFEKLSVLVHDTDKARFCEFFQF